MLRPLARSSLPLHICQGDMPTVTVYTLRGATKDRDRTTRRCVPKQYEKVRQCVWVGFVDVCGWSGCGWVGGWTRECVVEIARAGCERVAEQEPRFSQQKIKELACEL